MKKLFLSALSNLTLDDETCILFFAPAGCHESSK